MKKKGIFLIIFLALTGVALYSLRGLIFDKKDTLRIVTNVEVTELSPYDLNPSNLTRISNIYEGLVAFDAHLKIIPSLAVSWGNLSDTSWEFRLRQGVKFHDGSIFSPQDVLEAFDRAKKSDNHQIAGYIGSIKEMKVENGHLIINTHLPDPLLLSRLTKLFIYHEGNRGTGPYKVDEWKPGENLSLKVFTDYWGKQPDFKNVVYQVIPSQLEREQGFASGSIDVLVGVTEDQAEHLPSDQMVSGYGMEVNFLMFRLNDPLFQKRSIREAIVSLIDPDEVEAIGNHFVKRSNQFVAPGVFGYNPELPEWTYDPSKEARDLFGKRLERLSFDYPETYTTLSQYISQQLKKAGFSITSHSLKPDELLNKVSGNQSPFFMMGWLAENGDAGSFFDAFIHSNAPFNQGRYKNADIDRLIEKSRVEMDPQQRLTMLQEINAKVMKDLIGIPLFVSSRLFAVNPKIEWEARLDGLVLASEIRKK